MDLLFGNQKSFKYIFCPIKISQKVYIKYALKYAHYILHLLVCKFYTSRFFYLPEIAIYDTEPFILSSVDGYML